MATVTPSLTVKVEGLNILTEMEREVSWQTGEKSEFTYSIIDTDAAITIDPALIDNLKFILFSGTGDFTVNITAGGQTIAFKIQDFFLFSPTATFLATITAITLETDSTTTISVDVRIYGEA